MEQIIAWISAHPFQTFALYVIYMAAVQSLPAPTEKSSAFYLWAFKFLQLMAVNLTTITNPIKKQLPPPVGTETHTISAMTVEEVVKN